MIEMMHTSLTQADEVKPAPAPKRLAVIGDHDTKLTLAMMLAFQHLPQFTKIGCRSPAKARCMLYRGEADYVLASHADPDQRKDFQRMRVLQTRVLRAPAFVYGQFEKGGRTSSWNAIDQLPEHIICPADSLHHLSNLHARAPVEIAGDEVSAVTRARALAREENVVCGFLAAEFTSQHFASDAILYRVSDAELRLYSVLGLRG